MKNPIIPRTYINPDLVIGKTRFLIDRYGIEDFISKRRFKKEREKYIAACYLIGIRSVDNRLYWISTEASEAPDVIAAYFEIDSIGRKEYQLNIEVMAVTDFDKRPISRIIVDKLSKKAYPKDFKLICYIQRKGEKFIPLIVIHELSKLKLNIGEIIILVEVGGNHFILCKVFPDKFLYKFNMDEEVKKFNKDYESPFIETSLGRSAKTLNLGTGFYSYDIDNDDQVKKI
ncbi:MAG: hypothetical protein WAW00_01940 [Candidatus Moraniibacteriota bacterium]